jgi:hypothetical protein
MVAVVLYWSGSFIFASAVVFFRVPSSLFFLLSLLWTIPLPEVVLDPIVNLLQKGSVASAHVLLLCTGSSKWKTIH